MLTNMTEPSVYKTMPTFATIETMANGWQNPVQAKADVDLALAVGRHKVAAQLAAKGHLLFPDDDMLERAARVLAPPNVRVSPADPKSKGLNESVIWLREHENEYQGEWVVIQDGKLLFHTASSTELSEYKKDLSFSGYTLVTKIQPYDLNFYA